MEGMTLLLTIGELARRSGVPVRTLRFWSDEGVLPETDRSAGGYRRYDARAVARLDLVRTLRELGLGLDDVRLVLERRRSVEDVAAAHVTAIDNHIRVLRTQRAVCTLLARGTPSPRKAALMNDLARLSAAERRQLIDDFVDDAFAGTDPDAPGAGIADAMRTLPPELPDDPTTEQVEAWVELAELVERPGLPHARAGDGGGRPGGAPRHRSTPPPSPSTRERRWPRAPHRAHRPPVRCSTGSSPLMRTPHGWPTHWRRSPTGAWSATGRCSACSTAGTRSRPPCRRSSG